MSEQINLFSHYFNHNTGLSLPFVYIPYLQGKVVGILDDNKYYKYTINTENHYCLYDTILSEKDQWQESNESELIKSFIMLKCTHYENNIDNEYLVEFKFSVDFNLIDKLPHKL